MAARGKTWFPAKRWGWGWGLPVTWQGWVVLAAYALLVAFGWRAFPLPRHVLAFLVWSAGITAGLVAVCYLKGAPPRWRWGGR
ncbi:MAG TPA: hypothetical protein VF457_05710 [Burkholderiaceae bacterium]